MWFPNVGSGDGYEATTHGWSVLRDENDEQIGATCVFNLKHSEEGSFSYVGERAWCDPMDTPPEWTIVGDPEMPDHHRHMVKRCGDVTYASYEQDRRERENRCCQYNGNFYRW